jgi:replicative DNA helicase
MKVKKPRTDAHDQQAKEGAAAGRQSRLLTSAEFDEQRYSRRWLVRSLLLPSQPAIIGGPQKSLKTSLVVDMAIGLGTGTTFLDHFKVPRPARVAVYSGESGEPVLQETARRIAESKKVKLKSAEVLWSFDLPRLWSEVDLERLHDDLKSQGVEVVFLDPLYLCLVGGEKSASVSNLFQVGPLLLRAARACLRAGATPVLVHHTVKTVSKDGFKGPLGLDQLAFAGIAELARQWLLVNRREAYQPGSGNHELMLAVGGSAGHSGGWEVTVNEGVLDTEFEGKRWQVSVSGTARVSRTDRADRYLEGF